MDPTLQRKVAFKVVNTASIRLINGRNIKDIVKKFEVTGSVYDIPISGCPKTTTTDENAEWLLVRLGEKPLNQLFVCLKKRIFLVKLSIN